MKRQENKCRTTHIQLDLNISKSGQEGPPAHVVRENTIHSIGGLEKKYGGLTLGPNLRLLRSF